MKKLIRILNITSILAISLLLVACNNKGVFPEIYEIEDKVVVYNGYEQKLVFEGDLGDVRVEYSNNTHTSAGSYNVVATFYSDKYGVKVSNATFTIQKAPLDVSNFNLESRKFLFNKEYTWLSITNDVDDLENYHIDFEYYLKKGNTEQRLYSEPVNEGEYRVVAVITSNNHNYASNTIESHLTIVAGLPNGWILELNDKVVDYSGTAQSLKVVDNFDKIVDYDYKYYKVTDTGRELLKTSYATEVGEYHVIITIKTNYSDYSYVNNLSLTAKLIIR